MTDNKTRQRTSSQNFLKGAFVLTIGMIAVKLCGLAQKVLLTNLYSELGGNFAEFGTALFSNAYELYVPLFTLATVGFPVAVSRLISESFAKERYKDIKQIYKVAKPFFTLTGLLCFLLMVFGSFFYIRYINSPYSLPAMLILSPTIFFGCLVSIYRGYYEGLRDMTPTAVSEVLEAFSKIAVGVVLSYVTVRVGVRQYNLTGTIFSLSFNTTDEAYRTLVSISVAASIFGITMGSVIAFVYLRIRFALHKGDVPKEYYINSVEAYSKAETFRNMLRTALPVGVGALVMSVSSTIDATVIQSLMYNMAINEPQALMSEFHHVLDKEISRDKITIHTCIWGYYSASITLSSLVVAVTQVFGTSALPNVTNAYTKGNKEELKEAIEAVLRLTTIFAFPCAIGLFVLSEPILSLVYSGNPNISRFGGEVLQVLGLSVIFTGTITPVCAMLQGIGKVKNTMFIYIFGTLTKILVSYLFARNVQINITGAAIGSLVSNFLMCLVALFMLVKYTCIMPNFLSSVIKPMAGAVLCGICAYLFFYRFNINLMISIVISAIFYVLVLFILHTFTRNEILLLPNGKKIVIILEKLHLIG